MGIPNGKKFDLFPGVLRPRDVVGRVVEDPRRESQELGGALTLLQLPRRSPLGLGCHSWGPPSLPAAPPLAPGTHPPQGWAPCHPPDGTTRGWDMGVGWGGLGQATGAGHPGLRTDGLVSLPSRGFLGTGPGQTLRMTELGFMTSPCGGQKSNESEVPRQVPSLL